jgi:hypothetical protein
MLEDGRVPEIGGSEEPAERSAIAPVVATAA